MQRRVRATEADAHILKHALGGGGAQLTRDGELRHTLRERRVGHRFEVRLSLGPA